MLLARVGRLFRRNTNLDTVKTRLQIAASPEKVWQSMTFYEDVPTRPSPLMRLFLPAPVRTRGDKSRVGAIIECTYEGGGYLEKRMTGIERPRAVTFEVTLQNLGIEDAISMHNGAYELQDDGVGGTCVVLTTRYRGHLRPRWLWRPLERYLAHRLHGHILEGVRRAVARSGERPALAGSAHPAE